MKKYTIYDLEATCYDREEEKPSGFMNEIIEIGAIKVDEEGNILETFSKFLKPKKFPVISKFCHSLTTITQEDIDNAEDAWKVLSEFVDFVQGTELVSWGHYDFRQLKDDLFVNNMFFKIDRLPKHHSLKHLHAEWNGLHKKGIGLGRALKMESLSFDGTPHRGIDDAINIAKIFKKYNTKF